MSLFISEKLALFSLRYSIPLPLQDSKNTMNATATTTATKPRVTERLLKARAERNTKVNDRASMIFNSMFVSFAFAHSQAEREIPAVRSKITTEKVTKQVPIVVTHPITTNSRNNWEFRFINGEFVLRASNSGSFRYNDHCGADEYEVTVGMLDVKRELLVSLKDLAKNPTRSEVTEESVEDLDDSPKSGDVIGYVAVNPHGTDGRMSVLATDSYKPLSEEKAKTFLNGTGYVAKIVKV